MRENQKILGLDKMGIQKVMRPMDYVMDASGQVGMNLFTMLAGQLTYFYTDKVGVAAGMVASVMLIVKICDAFSDVIMGKLFDNTNSKNGKVAPWFIRMLIPAVVALIGLFTVPDGLSSGGQFLYILATNILHTSVVATAVLIPYGSLLSYRTNSIEERGKMSAYRSLVGMMVAMVVTIAIIPVTNALGGDQLAWVKAATISAIIVAVSFYLTYRTAKRASGISHKQEESKEEKISMTLSLKYLVTNKYWVLMLILNVVSAIAYALSSSTGVYYAKWILGDDNMVAVLGAISFLPMLLGYLIIIPISKRLGMVNTIMGGYMISIIASAVRCFMPYSFWATVVGGSLVTLGTIPMMCFSGALTNNITTYNEWKFGNKMVGMTNSAVSFGNKVASGFGSALLGWILALGDYDGKLSAQPDSAITAILAVCIYIPMLVYVFMLILVRMFDLEKIYPKLLKEIEERNAENNL